MLIEHDGKRPRVDATAHIAPTAVVCGDVTIGPGTHVAFGAVVAAEGAPVVIGADCMIRENAVVKASPGHRVTIGDAVLVGPHASIAGCSVGDQVFLATGVAIFHGARLGRGVEVRINGIVHVNTVLEASAMVPIGWVAAGDPAICFSPDQHEKIWAVQKPLNFPKTVYGVDLARYDDHPRERDRIRPRVETPAGQVDRKRRQQPARARAARARPRRRVASSALPPSRSEAANVFCQTGCTGDSP
jgi:carbonic anhydrase/acetyltransferase-like protein (isoleucine patch superfamily)